MKIQQGSIENALELQNQIPEFIDSYSNEEYHKRLLAKHLILIALVNDQPVGFKVGYALDKDTFYSWMGGVIPEYRQMNAAKQLAEKQEQWARQNGFKTVRFKTRNYLKSMLIFGLKHGFYITDVIRKDYPPTDYRIILEKSL